ncbi:ferredoxin-fold anticodon-binding domain-containing protein 1 [Eucyclogobius newberryi]|uniref:ferredoxin-fold anticodon-binding domain-containing protein 1 n=1 Tax=Eucyclogobius newberryi TaxID=166745 RepID=UPI003B59EDB7
MSHSRSVLLVGEGNFSFSASLCQSFGSDSSVIATCPQREDEALRHEGSANNIHIIREAGGTVLFDIDCTKLAECMSLKDHLFDLVIFNFPHCGRKSGVKKNRELLKNFFLSCVQVLSEDGEIHVSLCNGQGGTPADQPKREWHNSWQVAAMAAEAQLVLSDVQPFESEDYQSYKCTGYRSQDKGFRVEKALLHVFTHSLPYKSPQKLTVEESVEGERVQYQIPAELSDYMFRDFLKSGSVHPVKLAQDFVLEGLAENWGVSMVTETIPFLLSGKQVQNNCKIDRTQCYLIQLIQRDSDSESHPSADTNKSTILCSNSWTNKRNENSSSASVGSEKVDRARNKGTEVLKPVRSLEVDPEIEAEFYVLRPSLMAPLEDLIAKHKAPTTDCDEVEESEHSETSVNVTANGTMCSLWGISDVVFRNVPINSWALPVFHELLLNAALPSEPDPLKLFSEHLEKLLGPYGVSVKTEQEDLCLMAQPMGLVGKILAIKEEESHSFINLCINLNLDLLAMLLFALPDWRLLWSHDPRFYKQFSVRPSPGTPFCSFSLFPEHFRFDISFWTGPSWDESKFYSVVREASCGTVQQVKLIDTFSHPDLSQTSYCYRLVYHSHTHALSHTQALRFHKRLETVISTWLQVTVR